MKDALSTSAVFVVVLFLGLFAMAARNATDPDLWWHLKTGQLIVEQGRIPHADPFSYTRAGMPWVAHEWLTEVLLYELERTTGWAGLIIGFAAITAAAFYLMYLRCGRNKYVAGVGALCAAWGTIPLWGVRPQILSLLLTSLWLLILERSERAPRLLWWTLPLTLLWVNLHAGFALGLALSGLFLAGQWLERAMGRAQQHDSLFGKAALIFALDLLIVPLNPNGPRLFLYPIKTLGSSAMQSYIAEWASPNFHHAEYCPFLLIILGTFAILSSSHIRVRPRDLILLLVSLYAGLCSIRLIPLFALIAIPILAKHFAALLEKRSKHSSSRSPLPVSPFSSRSVFNGLIIAAMAIFAAVHITQVIQHEPQAEAEHFPVAAVAFLQSHPPQEHIFNNYDWGGYLIWKLYPTTRVFIDGRADLYGERMLHQFADTSQFKGSWQQAIELWKIDTVLVPADSPLATGLQTLPAWNISYQDSQAIILSSTLHPDQSVPATPTLIRMY